MQLKSFNSEDQVQETQSNTPNNKKKPIIFVVAIVAVLGIGLSAILIKNQSVNNGSTNSAPLTASDLAPYMPDYTVEEIQEIMDKPLTAEQQEAYDKLSALVDEMENMPEVEEVISVDPATGDTYYKSTDGNTYTYEDQFGYGTMTDEEAVEFESYSNQQLEDFKNGKITYEDFLSNLENFHRRDEDDVVIDESVVDSIMTEIENHGEYTNEEIINRLEDMESSQTNTNSEQNIDNIEEVDGGE